MSENTTPPTPDVEVSAPQNDAPKTAETKLTNEHVEAAFSGSDNSTQYNVEPTEADTYYNDILMKIQKEQENIIIRMVKMMVKAVTKFIFGPGDRPSREQFNKAMSERLEYATAAMTHDLSDLEQTLESRFLNRNEHMSKHLNAEFKLYQENPTEFNEKYRKSLGGDLENGLDRDQWNAATANMYPHESEDFLPHREAAEAAVEYHGKAAVLSLVKESLELSSQHLSEQVSATGSIKKSASVHGNDTKGLLKAKQVMQELAQQVLPLVHDLKDQSPELDSDQDKDMTSNPIEGGLFGFFKKENQVAEMDPEKRDAITAWLNELKDQDAAYMQHFSGKDFGNNYHETVLRNLPSHRALTGFADEIANVAIARTVEIAGKAQKFEIDVLPGATDYVRQSIEMGLNPGSDAQQDNADQIFSTKGGQSKHNQFDDVDRHHLDEISNFFQSHQTILPGKQKLGAAYEALENERAKRLAEQSYTKVLHEQTPVDLSEHGAKKEEGRTNSARDEEKNKARELAAQERAKAAEQKPVEAKPEDTSPEQSGP